MAQSEIIALSAKQQAHLRDGVAWASRVTGHRAARIAQTAAELAARCIPALAAR